MATTGWSWASEGSALPASTCRSDTGGDTATCLDVPGRLVEHDFRHQGGLCPQGEELADHCGSVESCSDAEGNCRIPPTLPAHQAATAGNSDRDGAASSQESSDDLIDKLKTENVQLGKALKEVRQMLLEVTSTMRSFFSDPSRRAWFKEQQTDSDLVRFFQRLIAWYKRMNENEKDPIVVFYRRLWQYERGCALDDINADLLAKDGASEDDRSKQTNERKNSLVDLSGETKKMSSARLYEACRVRVHSEAVLQENNLIRAENANLQSLVAKLQNTIDTMAKEEQAVPTIAESQNLINSSKNVDNAIPPNSSRTIPSKTLLQLAERQPKWYRLINDPDGLFNETDVVDKTYEEYLKSVLDIMQKHRCPFKRAIEISAENSTAAWADT